MMHIYEVEGKNVFPIYKHGPASDTSSEETGRFISYLHINKDGQDYRWAMESDVRELPCLDVIDSAKIAFTEWLAQREVAGL